MPEDESYWIHRKKDDKRLDWRMGEKNWIEGYWLSRFHPHRELILQELREIYPFKSLIEIGCNCGPNLFRIQKEFPKVKLAGLDVNFLALEEGKKRLPKVDFYIESAENFSIPDKTFDVCLTDAVLIYVPPEKIVKTLRNLIRITKKALILVEWKGKDMFGKVEYGHWARDYKTLFRKIFKIKKVKERKIKQEEWPSKNWTEKGYIFTVHLQ